MTVRNLTFARACEEALIAVLDAIAAVGEEFAGDTLRSPNSRSTGPYITAVSLQNGSSAVGG